MVHWVELDGNKSLEATYTEGCKHLASLSKRMQDTYVVPPLPAGKVTYLLFIYLNN